MWLKAPIFAYFNFDYWQFVKPYMASAFHIEQFRSRLYPRQKSDIAIWKVLYYHLCLHRLHLFIYFINKLLDVCVKWKPCLSKIKSKFARTLLIKGEIKNNEEKYWKNYNHLYYKISFLILIFQKSSGACAHVRPFSTAANRE